MVEGKCPKCGLVVYGWSLRFPRNQACIRCGTALVITEDGKVVTGYSPFTAEEYKVKPPDETTVPQSEDKSRDEQNK